MFCCFFLLDVFNVSCYRVITHDFVVAHEEIFPHLLVERSFKISFETLFLLFISFNTWS